MMALLAAGIGLCVVGVLAIALGFPISETSFGNALLIAGVFVVCTGLILTGMWLATRALIRTISQQAQADGHLVGRPGDTSRSSTPFNPFDPSSEQSAAASADNDKAGAQNSEIAANAPPWAGEAASRDRGRARPAAPEIPPPVEAPPVPDRPARRNLLFSTKRRDKPESLAPVSSASVPTPALEAEPKVSFENAWPQSPRAGASGASTDRPAAETVILNSESAAISSGAVSSSDSDTAAASGESTEDQSDATVIKSGVVDGMSYTLYSDGSIEAKLPGEGPIRFSSLEALRTYLDQRE